MESGHATRKLQLRRKLGLLVSVRNESEAATVDSVGVDILDIKEPNHGSLGRTSHPEVLDILSSVRASTMVSMALGELDECESYLADQEIPKGISFAKCGVANVVETDWKTRLSNVWTRISRYCRPVAVAYSDFENSRSPSPLEVLAVAQENNLEYFLLDTFTKDGKTTFDWCGEADLLQLSHASREAGIKSVLAGSLDSIDLPKVLDSEFDVVAVRGAVCSGGREQTVSVEKVTRFKQEIESVCHTLS